MNRKGITPIIAVALLMMMTIAMAGAAYLWLKNVQGTIIGKINLETELEIRSKKCYANTNKLELAIQNVGKSPVDMIPVNVFAYDGAGELKLSGANINEGRISDPDKWRLAQKRGGFTGKVNLTLDGTFIDNEYYTIKIEFPYPIKYTKETSCIAE